MLFEKCRKIVDVVVSQPFGNGKNRRGRIFQKRFGGCDFLAVDVTHYRFARLFFELYADIRRRKIDVTAQVV